jgi:hypothetical protein
MAAKILTEWPIIFSTPMVKKIMSGDKMMTRRVIQEIPTEAPVSWFLKDLVGEHRAEELLNPRWKGFGVFYLKAPDKPGLVRYPYGCAGPGIAGSTLWCRESFLHFKGAGKTMGTYKGAPMPNPAFKADYEGNIGLKWKPSIHMPRSICRTRLITTCVRFEHLQDITEDDAKLEGFASIAEFRTYWNHLNSVRGPKCFPWGSNPWTWVLIFKRKVA